MRAPCIPLILGVAVACAGEPFSLASNRERSDSVPTSTNAASGSSALDPPTKIDPMLGGSGFAQGGTSLSSGDPRPRGEGGIGGAAVDAAGGPQVGGEGGATSAPECPSVATEDWELAYFPELGAATTQESHPFFRVTNRGEPTTLDRLVIRYYFTKESNVAETASCYWVTGDRCSLAKLEFHDVPVPTADAARYLEVSFPGASTVLVAAAALEVRVGFRTGSDVLLQANDYSFDTNAAAANGAAPFPYKRWPQATLYQDGDLVWGKEPCARTVRLPMRD